MISRKLILKTNAQSDSITYPTIPYIPPGNVTVTPTINNPSIPVPTGPIIYLTSDKLSYDIGNTGKIQILIDTKNQEIDEFKIIIEYDRSHIQIRDADVTLPGIQIIYLDTHFEVVNNGNIVETNLADNKGRITLQARARNDEARTITQRAVAEIEFLVIASKNSEINIINEESSLILNNINRLDEANISPLTISSLGGVNPSVIIRPSGSIIPTISSTPKTALDSTPQGVIILIIGITFTLIGFYIKTAIKKTKSDSEW